MNILPEVVIDSTPNSYDRNADLLARLISGLTDNSNFLTPSPTIAVLSAQQTALVTAIGVWGPKGNRGGKAALLSLREQSATAYSLIKAEAQYITGQAIQESGSDTIAMAAIMSTCGLEVRTTRSPQGALGQVRDIHQVNSPGLNRNQVDWHWTNPLGVTAAHNVKIRKVFRNTINDFTTAELIATPSKSRFVDTNSTGVSITYYYWFCVVTSVGDSTLSDAVSVMLLPA